MSLVATIDFISFLAVIVALIALGRGWKRALPHDIKLLIVVFLGLSLFHHVSNILEWGEISKALDPFEDFVELLIPMLWFMLIYSYLKELTTDDLRKSERSLQESETKFRELADLLPQTVFETDTEAQLTYVNQFGFQTFGYTDKDFQIGLNALGMLIPEQRDRAGRNIGRIMAGENFPEEEYTALRKNGSTFPVIIYSNQILRGGETLGLRGIIVDITEPKRAEADRELLLSAIEQAAETIVITNAEGYIQYANPAFEQITGYTCEEAIGQNPRILKSDEHGDAFYKEMWNTLTRGDTWRGRFTNRKKDGMLYTEDAVISPVRDASGRTVNYVAVKRDITEEIKLEERLRQAQKMEAIGVLAGGVAHDFNNILTIIIGNAGLALMKVGKGGPLREEIEAIKAAGERATSLTRQLLAFSRKQIMQPKILDLNELLTDIKNMLGRLIGEDVEILTIPRPELWQVEADPGQMEQVIMNLVVNAKDAMPKGGKLTLKTANVNLDGNYFRNYGIKEEQIGSYVMLAVSDTGIGMDKETQEHIFEPFFTTKEIGKGTGLGLSTVYGIAKQNNGFVWVYSEPGQGTTFKVYLPKVKGNVEVEEKEQTSVSEVDGSETVLIVEDDESLRNLAGTVLKQKGYKVLKAENGEDALRVSKAHDGSFDLLITDVVMPKISGKEVAKRLQPLYPHMKVIYMSGYTGNAIAHHGVLAPGLNFIEKPFSPEALARKAREVLDKKQD